MPENYITLNGHQLKAALAYLNPDGDDYKTQLDHDICIAHFNDGHNGPGNYSTAIVEWPDGSVENVPVERIRFIDGVQHA